ncbi:T9SS type A sorting domain-containing protein [Brumimicrobium mesophilum]|uniref:T9SS type A sorting domain-containing protein n=1 Tax=Brumimicrobium mesophilum TaxID=392717 RepID=UPI000D13F314|nr:T9SS type A sorting domain-containing protein [Brumimicrobium mesophilum]
MRVSILFLLSILLSSYALSADRFWIGMGTTNWNDQNNWTDVFGSGGPASVPGSADIAIFTSGVWADCDLDINVSIAGIITTGYDGTIDLNGNTFQPVAGATGNCIFGGGTIINSSGVSTINIVTSGEISFNSFTLGSVASNINLNITASEVRFGNSTFYSVINATQTGGTNTAGSGGNIFHDEVAFTNTGSGYFYFGFTNPDEFNGEVKLFNTGISSLRLAAGSVGTQFNEDIEVNSSNGIGVEIGGTLGGSVMANTKTITVGSNGFTSGDLNLRNFTQSGNTTQNIILTGTSKFYTNYNTTFEGDLNVIAPQIELKASTFIGVTVIEKTGPGNNESGGNYFQDSTVISNSGSGNVRFGTGFPDEFYKDLILNNSGSATLEIAETSPGNSIDGDLFIFTSGISKDIAVSNESTSSISILGNVYVLSASSAEKSNIYIGNEGDVNIGGRLDIVQNATGDSTTIRVAETEPSAVSISGVAKFVNNGSGDVRRMYMGYSGDITFGDSLIIENNAIATLSGIYLNHFPGSTNYYNGAIVLTNTGVSSDGIYFGNGSGIPIPGGFGILAAGQSISIGAAGFDTGELYFRNFTQLGSTPQVVISTGTDTELTILFCDWQGGGDFISPRITTRDSHYGDSTHLEKTGINPDLSEGNNVFDSNSSMRNTGSGSFIMGNTNPDTWNANLKVISEGSGDLHVAYNSAGNVINGDLDVVTTSTGASQNSIFSYTAMSTLEVGGSATVRNNAIAGNVGVILGYEGDINFLGSLEILNTAISTVGELIIARNPSSVVNITGISNLVNLGNGGDVKRIVAGLKGDVTFNNTLNLNNSATSTLDSYILLNSDVESSNAYNGDILLNSTTNGASSVDDGIFFGRRTSTTAGQGTLGVGYSISVGTSDFIGKRLLFRNFTQLGTTTQSFVPLLGLTRFESRDSEWNGPVNFISSRMFSNTSIYNSPAFLEKTGAIDDLSSGGNTFNGTAILKNSGAGNLVFANLNGNDFNDDVSYVETGSGAILPTYNASSTYEGAISVNSATIVVFGSNSGGRVVMDGTIPQFISAVGSTPRPEFRALETQNPNEEITLGTPIIIDKDLRMVQGNIVSSLTNLVTMVDGSIVSNVSDNGFVEGPISKIGKPAFVFPVGKQGYYRPISISEPNVINAEFRAEYFPQDVVTSGTPDNPVETSIDHVSDCEYWILDKLNGISTIAVEVTLSYRDIPTFGCSGVNIPIELLVSRWDGSIWKDHGNGGNTGTAANGAVTSAGTISNFSPFTIATTTANNPLPIELIEFKVEKQGSAAMVNWSTASELNNDYFNLERSTDGYNFETITIVDGAGNSSEIIEYDYLDREPKTGINYYRLKQIDFDGQFSFSDIKSVEFDAWDYLNIYPNPLISGRDLLISSTGSISKVELINGTGELVKSFNFTEITKEVKLKNIKVSSGVYFVKVYTNEEVEVRKLIVK